MKKLCVAVLAIWSFQAHAGLPVPPPRLIETPTLATLRYCLTFSVRAAWGAQARFKGAPSAFKYVARDTVHEYFMSDSAPPDGIYIAEDLDGAERRAYEEVAFFGWNRMDAWLKAQPDTQEPEWTALPALFFQICQESVSEKPAGERRERSPGTTLVSSSPM